MLSLTYHYVLDDKRTLLPIVYLRADCTNVKYGKVPNVTSMPSPPFLLCR